MLNWLRGKTKSEPSKHLTPEHVTHKEEPRSGEAIIMITGTSGSGRKRIAAAISAELGIPYVKSYTTRPPRPGEKAGEHYYFISEETFEAMDKQGDWLESVRLARGRYGVAKLELEHALQSGGRAILVLNPAGASQLKSQFGAQALRVFVFVTKEDIMVRLAHEHVPQEVHDEYMISYSEQVRYKNQCEFVLQNMEDKLTISKIVQYIQDAAPASKREGRSS